MSCMKRVLKWKSASRLSSPPRPIPWWPVALRSFSVARADSSVTPWIVQKTPPGKIPLSEFTIRMLRAEQSATLLMAIAL